MYRDGDVIREILINKKKSLFLNKTDIAYLENKGARVGTLYPEFLDIMVMNVSNGEVYFKPLVDDWLKFRDEVKSDDVAKDLKFFVSESEGGYGVCEGDIEDIKKFNISYDDVRDYLEEPYKNLNNKIYELDTVVREMLGKMYD